MNEEAIQGLKDLFDRIVCLAVEGPGVCAHLKLLEAIKKEAMTGYNLCKRHLSNQSNGQDNTCPKCGAPFSSLVFCKCTEQKSRPWSRTVRF